MRLPTTALTFSILLALAACGGGSTGANGGPTPGPATQSVAAGTSLTLTASMVVLVPAGTIVCSPGGNSAILNGRASTLNVEAGAVVSVPATATGPPDNTVTARAGASGASGAAGACVVNNPVANIARGTAHGAPIAGSSSRTELSFQDGSGDQATFSQFQQFALHPNGNIIASQSGVLRQVAPAGVATTLSTGARQIPRGFAFDPNGNLFAIDGAGALFKQSVSGAQTTLNDHWKTDDGADSMLIDRAGNLYLADYAGRRIVKFSADGVMSLLAGNGSTARVDGNGASASFLGPVALALDGQDNLFVNDTDAVRKVTPDGHVSTLAQFPKRIIPFDGAIAVDRAGNVYVPSDYFSLIQIDPNGRLTGFSLETTLYILTMMIDANGDLIVGTGWASPSQIWKVTF